MKKVASLILALVMCLTLCACGSDTKNELTETLCSGEWVSSDHIFYLDTIDRKCVYTILQFFEDGTCRFICEDYREGTLTDTSYFIDKWKIEGGKIVIFRGNADSDEDTIYLEYNNETLTGSTWYCNYFSYTHASTQSTIPPETTVPATTEPTKFSAGLKYEKNEDGTYTVVGIGSCKDKEIIIPAQYNDTKVTAIGYKAFAECSNLTSVIIPDGITTIVDAAFIACTNLTSVIIPDSVTTIGGNAFSKCHSLTGVTIPDSVISIGEFAFYGCFDMTELIIGNSVTDIGTGAFSNCTSLTSVTIPDSVTNIGSTAFQECSSLVSVTIGSGVTFMDTYAFAYCDNLTDLIIKSGTTCIGEDAFTGSNITSVTIPDSVTSIGERAFSSCKNLTNVTIGNGITTIIRGVFSNCSSLTNVTIPNSVIVLGDASFYACSSLTKITFSGTKEQWGAITKYDNWDKESKGYTVYCTDGEISQ